jgi:flagellar hook assembly protein FlgD
LSFFLIIPKSLFAAVPPTPDFQALKNYNGALAVFWNVNGNPTTSTDYFIYISTGNLTGMSYSQLETNPAVRKINASYLGVKNMHAFYENTINNTRYYVSIVANDYASTPSTSAVVGPRSVTAISDTLSISNQTTSVDGRNTYKVDYDSQTITLKLTAAGAGDGFVGQGYLWLDIVTRINSKSTLVPGERIAVPLIITFSSTTFSATATFTWDCFINAHGSAQHKHNGEYYINIYPTKSAADTIGQQYVTIDVLHVNIGNGIVYNTQGDSSKELHYGPPFKFDYYLSKSAFVTMKIWDRNQTLDTSDDKLVRVVVSSSPRKEGDNISSPNKGAAPEDWDKTVQIETWDGRNEKGLIVNNDIYRYTFDAIEFWGQPGSGFDQQRADSSHIEGTIAFDVLRFINVSSIGITPDTSLGHIKYTLAGANSQMGGAKIKIIICSPGTTFYMSSTSGSINYLNGSSTYTYVAGDPIPFNKKNIKKIFILNRSAGDHDETWNGYDEAGNALTNDSYVFAVSAIDDSGNHAIDNSGNDKVIIGNITIDRTASQAAGDSTPPTITSVSIGGSAINSSGNTTIAQPFTTIAVGLNDTGGSGLNLTGSVITLSGPNSTTIAVTPTDDGQNTITLTCTQQTTSGIYTMRITPKDKAGNTASDSIYTFTLSITQAGVQAAFQQSIYAYPNPAKGVTSVTFAYNSASPTTATLEIFNILGEIVYKEDWNVPTAGAQTKAYNLLNESGKKLATGLYLYRITLGNTNSDKKDFKKLVVIQ